MHLLATKLKDGEVCELNLKDTRSAFDKAIAKPIESPFLTKPLVLGTAAILLLGLGYALGSKK